MSERTLRPGHMASAAVFIGGLLIVVMPQYVLGFVQLVAVTIAASAVLHALAVHAPDWAAAGAWLSPFEGRIRSRPRDRGWWELGWIRSKLSGRRQRVPHGPPLPPGALHLLQPLIAQRLERKGLGPDDEAYLEAARGVTSPLTWAVLAAEPLGRPSWFRTLRPAEGRVGEAIHRVLDELDRMAPGRGDPVAQPNHAEGRST